MINLQHRFQIYISVAIQKKAIPLAEKGRALAEKELGTKDPNYGYWLDVLGLLYRDLGDYSKAEQNFNGSLNIIINSIGKKHPNYRKCLHNLASLYKDMGEYEKSEKAFQEVLELIKSEEVRMTPNMQESSMIWACCIPIKVNL